MNMKKRLKSSFCKGQFTQDYARNRVSSLNVLALNLDVCLATRRDASSDIETDFVICPGQNQSYQCQCRSKSGAFISILSICTSYFPLVPQNWKV